MNCWGCGAPTRGADGCPTCGRLQPLAAGADYYAVFGYPKPVLVLDEKELEKRFHEKSRLFHPDRYQRKEPKELEISLERSAALNEAYRTLRDRKARAEYAVRRFSGEAGKENKNVPVELAEIYFDLQDLLIEPGQESRTAALRGELVQKRTEAEAAMRVLMEEWDRSGSAATLGRLRDLLHQDNYVESMLADIEKKTGGKQ